MNKIIENPLVIIVIIGVIILTGCKKKEEVPVTTTTAVSNVTGTTAISGGTITDEGSSTVISRGVCWSTGTEPTVSDSKTSDGAGAGSFTSNITGLNGATNYFVRAYATNSAGTGYGMAMSFTSLGEAPLPTISNATSFNATDATLSGYVNPNYLSTIVTFEYGTTTNYGSTVTATQSPVTGNTNTNVSASITGLIPGGTTYHVRIKAVNSLGTTYSNDITFTTLGQVPTVTTLAATNTTTVEAKLNGTVKANYLSSSVTFEYGTTTSYGSTASATQSPVTGNTITNVSANITGLTAGTTYHFRIKAVNSLGTSYSNDMTFTTLGQVPGVTILSASNITLTGGQLNGTVNANYLATTVIFEYGITTSYGSTITATQSPITGSTNINVSASVTGLTLGTTYHYRIIATNSIGTRNSTDMTFATLGQVPTVLAQYATNITSATAQLNGSVNANYLATTVTFEYGATTSYGNTIIATQNPVTGGITTEVSANIAGLTELTVYHFRIKAENSLGITFSNDMPFMYIYLGANYQGGLVFYIDGSGVHGLVSAPTDQGSGILWGCNGTAIVGADGTATGTGYQNTIDIVNGCTTTGIAASTCSDLNLNGFTDWFLPSKDELNLMFKNLKKNGLGGFVKLGDMYSYYYWSSSEVSGGAAWIQDFWVGSQNGNSKNGNAYIRAARAF